MAVCGRAVLPVLSFLYRAILVVKTYHDTIGKPTYRLPKVVVNNWVNNNWLVYSDFVLWLEIVSHNGLDAEVYDLRPADYTTSYYYCITVSDMTWLK